MLKETWTVNTYDKGFPSEFTLNIKTDLKSKHMSVILSLMKSH